MGAPANQDDRAPGEGFLVLWAGERELTERDVQVELRHAGVRVEVVDPDELARRAVVRAPDLVVLASAAGEDPEPHALALAALAPAASIPLVALAARPDGAPRAQARFGLVARLDRDLAPVHLGSQIRRVLQDIASRPSAWRVRVPAGDMVLSARRLASAGRSGLLVAESAGAAVALEAGGEVASETVAAAPAAGEAVFHERLPGSVRVITRPERAARGSVEPSLEGVRLLVLDDDERRCGQLVRGLERAGAQARGTGVAGLGAARSVDPSVVVVGAPVLGGAGPLWTDPRLRAAGLLVLDGEALAQASAALVLGEVARMTDAELALGRRLRAGDALAERLETLGPARWLRLLGRCEHPVTLRVFGAAGRARVDLASGRVRGASFRRADETRIDDPRAAVDVLMGMPFGRVLAGPVDAIDVLEGSAARKPSVVSGMTPLAEGRSRSRGLVVEEVVVKRTDATRTRPSSLPLIGAERGEVDASASGRSSDVPLGDLADDDDFATGTYAPEMLAELRAALAPKVESSTPAEPLPRVRAGVDVRAAESGDAQPIAESSESAAVVTTERTAEPAEPPFRKELEPVSVVGPPPPGPRVDAPRDELRPPEPAPRLATALPTPPARSPRATIFYALGTIIVLSIGGWAAWRLHGADPLPVAVPPARSDPAESVQAPSAGPVAGEDQAAGGVEVEATPIEPGAAQLPAEPADPAADPAAEPLVDLAGPTAELAAEVAGPAADVPPDAPDALAETAADPPALLAEAIRAAQASDYARSEALCRQALAIAPRNARAGYRLAVALFRQRRSDEALQAARDASEWDTSDALALALIGDIHTRHGRFGEAARAYRQALEREPRFGPAQRGLERLEGLGRRQGAAAP